MSNLMTPEQRSLARHALGLPNRQRRSYRRHFVTGSGSPDHQAWEAMVAVGYAQKRPGDALTGGDDCFLLTEAGATLALEKGERLDSETFPYADGLAGKADQ